MAANIPAPLKSADIARFAQRAGQVEKAKPVIAYWCNYWIVNQILSKGLHNIDDECMTFTMNLMDKLEQTKSDHAQDDAIIDDAAGQAYIEQFGEETLQRAENAMRANKASRQTADTLQAAATFLDLCQIWGPLEPEVASKIKFAKYHALRIAKAIKAREDPNLSNPVPEPVLNNETMGFDPNDTEIHMLNEPQTTLQNQTQLYQPSVEEVPDEHDRLDPNLAQRSSVNESRHPSRVHSYQNQPNQNMSDQHGVPSPQEDKEHYYRNGHGGEVSPLTSPNADRTASDGGGYFPRVPDQDDPMHVSALPDAPPRDPGPPYNADLADFTATSPAQFPTSGQQPPHLPPRGSLEPSPPPRIDQPSEPTGSQLQYPSHAQSELRRMPAHPSSSHAHPPAATQPPPHVTQGDPPHPAVSQPNSGKVNYVADEDAILKAQKRARWAISALNFEDVNTAVKELRGALEVLGAR